VFGRELRAVAAKAAAAFISPKMAVKARQSLPSLGAQIFSSYGVQVPQMWVNAKSPVFRRGQTFEGISLSLKGLRGKTVFPGSSAFQAAQLGFGRRTASFVFTQNRGQN
jgi:hypothetical protein